MNYKEIKIDIKNLHSYEIPSSSEPFILTINDEEIKFEFLIKNIEKTRDILVMGSGSFDSSKMNLPIFHRHAWIKEFKETVIMYNDPTLYLGEITLGWGNGTEDRYYLEEISQILKVLLGKLNYGFENTFLYGSSAGGYMSLILAGYLKGSTALVNNPQTVLFNFWRKPVNSMLEVCYPGRERSEVASMYSKRVNVIEFYCAINYIPKIYYLQNVAAKMDVEKHLIPFISGLNELSETKDLQHVNVQLYSNPKLGHNPVSKDDTFNFIERIINESNI